MTQELFKPLIGFTCGDLNGIGLELVIKTLSDNRILTICTPIVFASSKSIHFYRKFLPEHQLVFQPIKDFSKINNKQINIFNCWEEEVAITPGELNETGGKYALQSLQAAVDTALKGHIHGLVTAPIHKKNIRNNSFSYTGHTPYLKSAFKVEDVVMLMAAENLRVALVTEHIPIKEVAQQLTTKRIVSKLQMLHASLIRDFGIEKPKMAVLGLNPHAGDEGLIGNEENTIIKPAIQEVTQAGIMAFGPYSADAFFARGHYTSFDAVLAMYHDQGLIPFKSLDVGEGVNFTTGLPIVRTSPDHGTAFDIAGKGIADPTSFLQSIFICVDIIRQRNQYNEDRKNPLKKISKSMIASAEDEKVEE